MGQFNLRSIFVVVSFAGVLFGVWLRNPFWASVAFVVGFSILAYFVARTNQVRPGFRWLGASLGAVFAMMACVFFEYYWPSSEEVRIGLSRAIPISILVSLVLGVAVSLTARTTEYLLPSSYS